MNFQFCPVYNLYTAKGKGRWVIIELEVNVGDQPPVIWVYPISSLQSNCPGQPKLATCWENAEFEKKV